MNIEMEEVEEQLTHMETNIHPFLSSNFRNNNQHFLSMFFSFCEKKIRSVRLIKMKETFQIFIMIRKKKL
jgi:hypothetical protein